MCLFVKEHATRKLENEAQPVVRSMNGTRAIAGASGADAKETDSLISTILSLWTTQSHGTRRHIAHAIWKVQGTSHAGCSGLLSALAVDSRQGARSQNRPSGRVHQPESVGLEAGIPGRNLVCMKGRKKAGRWRVWPQGEPRKRRRRLDAKDRLILKMLKTFESLGSDGMARIDSRLWFEYFRRRVKRLGLGRLEAGAGDRAPSQ